MPATPNTHPEQIVDKNGKTTTVHKGRTTAASGGGGRGAKLTLTPAAFVDSDESTSPAATASNNDRALAEFSEVLSKIIEHEDARAMSYNKNIAAQVDTGFAAINSYKEAIDAIARRTVFKYYESDLRSMREMDSDQKMSVLDWKLATQSKNSIQVARENPSLDSIAVLSAVSELQSALAMARFNSRK